MLSFPVGSVFSFNKAQLVKAEKLQQEDQKEVSAIHQDPSGRSSFIKLRISVLRYSYLVKVNAIKAESGTWEYLDEVVASETKDYSDGDLSVYYKFKYEHSGKTYYFNA
ncbi:hypothetical protein [Sediminitomix flava]|uniref:Uncharacterized protein n=1 Tax=Sediminitomix flava TaxID=379075 RepID=A0A315ZYN4_SEDFL|nr:hypothetical protein [Sediminitomix flava]PWJ42477.1 hypothetical protein BC781_10218 [Sediminitomix flava]